MVFRNPFLIIFVIPLAFLFIDTAGAQTVAPSAFRLSGTVEGKAFAGAVIIDAAGTQTFYRLYDKLPDGSQIVQVRSNSISLKGESGTRYDIYINHDMKTVGATSQSAHIDPYSPPTTMFNAQAGQPNPRRGGRRSRSSSEED